MAIHDPVADWLAAATLILFCSTVLFGVDAIIRLM